MKRVTISVVVLALVLSISAFGLAAVKKGPFVDTIIFDVRMDQAIGIKDTAAGKTDIFLEGISAPMIRGLDKAELSKLELYSVPSSSYSLFMNPIPNKAPYTHKVNGKEVFNPFAIREVRFAMNFLINRKYIVDEILGGAGGPMYTLTTPGQPGTVRYELTAAKMGFTPEGDESRALKEINDAMTKASQLPEVKGKLKKDKNVWMFNGQPVTIKFAIRVDDPNVRVREGEYVSQQLEKAGFKVEKLMWDRSKCNAVVYGNNPADYEWTLYTEAWLAGATRAWWAHIIAQFYGPWYGYMPGSGNPANWNYENKAVDEHSQNAYLGKILTEEEYWDEAMQGTTAGLKDAVRIFVAYEAETYVANKAAFQQRMVYGMGDGLTNKWALILAKPKKNTLRVTQYSAQGGLFMNAWDPIGPDGFADAYSRAAGELLFDPGTFESPVDAGTVWMRTINLSYDSKLHKDAKGNLVGDIAVPADAQYYDAKTNKFVKVGAGKKAQAVGKYKFVWSNFHHGIPMSMEDYLYGDHFLEEWRIEDTPGDKWYDAEIDNQVTPTADIVVGKVYDFKNNTITVYANSNFPADKNYAAAQIAPGWSSSMNAGVGVSWEIAEAMARMVAQGAKSKTVYSFSQTKEGTTEVDALDPKCVADIKAELQDMINEKYIPAPLKGFTTADKAVKRYQAAIKFIDTYHNAYISNGPFFLAKYDAKNHYAELRAFRDASYPYTAQQWLDSFKRTILSVDKVEMSLLQIRGKDIPVRVRVAQSSYPEANYTPATTGKVTVSLLTDKGELKFEAKRTAAGVFDAKIDGAKTKDLKPGSYTVLITIPTEGKVVGTNMTKTLVLR